tara:strand:- start:696 stop:875 length:180 start_codon:yes stop_codon:yes gene_type:complete
LVVLTLGTITGAVIGVLLPVIVPGTLLWQRYVTPWNRMRNVRKIMDAHRKKMEMKDGNI